MCAFMYMCHSRLIGSTCPTCDPSWVYGNLVYKFKKIVGRADFSDQFRKIIVRYKRIGYNIIAFIIAFICYLFVSRDVPLMS